MISIWRWQTPCLQEMEQDPEAKGPEPAEGLDLAAPVNGVTQKKAPAPEPAADKAGEEEADAEKIRKRLFGKFARKELKDAGL